MPPLRGRSQKKDEDQGDGDDAHGGSKSSNGRLGSSGRLDLDAARGANHSMKVEKNAAIDK